MPLTVRPDLQDRLRHRGLARDRPGGGRRPGRAGADLALVARSEDGLAETARAGRRARQEGVRVPADVTNQEAVEAAVAEAIERLGHIDIVVNNAAAPTSWSRSPRCGSRGWDKVIQLNLDSTVYVCHAVGQHLLERGTGSVINVASVGGLLAAPFSPYGAAKAAWSR